MNSLNLDYFIHYSSFCDEHSWRPVTKKTSLISLNASVPWRRVKSFCMRHALMKNLTTKILRHFRLSKLDPQAHDILGSMFYKCIIDRRKSGFDFNGITALSLCRRFNMSVQLHFFLFLWKPSELLNATFFSREIWCPCVKISPLQYFKV